jgi:hypothetical protein
MNRDACRRSWAPTDLLLPVLLLAAFLLSASPAQAAPGVVDSFGGFGSEEGQFLGAAGVDVLSTSGDVYVADSGNLRVQRFDEDGNFELAFGSGGEGAGQFGESGPSAVAVDSSTGSVYVFDPANGRVQKFDADGNFELAFGWGVADGSPELQRCTATCLPASGGPGSGVGQFGEGAGQAALAVDPTSGNLLVSDPGNFRVEEFDPEGQFVRSFGRDVEAGGGEGFEVCAEAAKCKAGIEGSEPGALGPSGPASLSVDAAGVIYAAETYGSPRLERFTPDAGTLVPSFFATGEFPVGTEASPYQVAVVRASGNVAVAYRNPSVGTTGLKVLTPSGDLAEAGPSDMGFYGANGLTFGTTSGRGYISSPGRVFVLDQMAAPQAAIEPVTDVTATSATLHGVVSSQGEPAAHYRFEYMLDGGEWQSGPEGTVPPDSSDHQLTVELSPRGGRRAPTTSACAPSSPTTTPSSLPRSPSRPRGPRRGSKRSAPPTTRRRAHASTAASTRATR